MRSILFRGKRKDNGAWVSGGSLIRFNMENAVDCDLVFMPQMNEMCFCSHDEHDNITSWERVLFYKIDPQTVGQFTGLDDSEFHSIFEGDIVRTLEDSRCFEIRYDAGEFSFFRDNTWYDRLDSYNARACIVLGNIYDNPELLREEDDDAEEV